MSELVDCINALSAKDIIKSIAKTANGTPFYLQTVGAGGFCDEYQRIYDDLDGIGTPPSAAIAAAQNTMVCGLVSAGVWAKLDVFYLFAQTTNAGGEAVMNWVTTGFYNATPVNAPAFVALEGFTGDGLASYIDCNWPTNNGVNYALNNAMYCVYVRNNIQDDGYTVGTEGGSTSRTILRVRNSGDIAQGYINANGAVTYAANTEARGLWSMNRSGAIAFEMFQNKTSRGTAVTPAAALSAFDIAVLAWNDTGVMRDWSKHQVSMFAAGADLTVANRSDLVDLVEAYMDSNGKGIIP